MKCDFCIYHSLYEMITSSRGYSYSADIPCQRCIRFLNPKDEYVPMAEEEATKNEKQTINLQR